MDWLEAVIALAFMFCFVMFCSHVIVWAFP